MISQNAMLIMFAIYGVCCLPVIFINSEKKEIFFWLMLYACSMSVGYFAGMFVSIHCLESLWGPSHRLPTAYRLVGDLGIVIVPLVFPLVTRLMLHKWRVSERRFLGQVRKRAKRLCRLIPNLEWHNLRMRIRQIPDVLLPPLLAQRTQLRAAVKLLAKSGGKTVEQSVHDLTNKILQGTVARKGQVEDRLREVEAKIQTCEEVLLALEPHLIALSCAEIAVEDVEAHLSELVCGIESSIKQAEAAQVEAVPVSGRSARATKLAERN